MTRQQQAWVSAAMSGRVWRRSIRLGLPVGMLQVMVNHGDTFMRHAAVSETFIKSILSPLLSISVAWVAAAATHANHLLHEKDTSL